MVSESWSWQNLPVGRYTNGRPTYSKSKSVKLSNVFELNIPSANASGLFYRALRMKKDGEELRVKIGAWPRFYSCKLVEDDFTERLMNLLEIES